MFDLDGVNPPVPPTVYTDTLTGLPNDILQTMITQGLAPDTETAIVTKIPESGTSGQPNYYPGGTYTEKEEQRRVRSLGSKQFPFALAQGIITNENKTFKSVNAAGVISYIQKGNAIKAFRGRKNGLDFVVTDANTLTFTAGAYYLCNADIRTTFPAINIEELWVIREDDGFTLNISAAVNGTTYAVLGDKNGIISYIAKTSLASNFPNIPTAEVFGFNHYVSSTDNKRILGFFTKNSTIANSIVTVMEDFVNPIRAQYTLGAQTPVVAVAIVQANTKVEDTHYAVTTGASWNFTAPYAGWYLINLESYSSVGQTISDTIHYRLYKNGAVYTTIAAKTLITAIAYGCDCSGCVTMKLKVGDTIDIRWNSSFGSMTCNINGGFITITRLQV